MLGLVLEIELPDGTILEAPDDADIPTVVQGYVRSKTLKSNPGEYDPNSREFKKKYGANPSKLEAFQSGVRRLDSGAGNVLKSTLGKIPTWKPILDMLPERTSDESLKETDELDQQIKEQRPWSRMGGEIAGSIPLSVATAGFGAPSTGAPLLTRALATLGKSGLEGAVQGASASEVDEQGEGAGKGAALSMVLSLLGMGGGRLVRGLVKKSEAAEELQHLAGQHGEELHLPISQAASDKDVVSRVAQTFYQDALPLVPGVRGRLERQGKSALEQVRNMALKEAVPDGGSLIDDAGQRAGEAVRNIRGQLDNAYKETVESYSFNIPENFREQLSKKITAQFKNIDDTTLKKALDAAELHLKRFSSDKNVIDGQNLLNAKSAIGKAISKADDVEKGPLGEVKKYIDELIESELSIGSKKSNLVDLSRYQNLAEPARHLTGPRKAAAAARAKKGNFSMSQLANNATDDTQMHLAQVGNEVFSNPAAKGSFVGRILAGVGIGGYGVFMDPGSAVAAVTIANLLANKSSQRALLGDTATQKVIAELLRKYPEVASMLGSTGRMSAVLAGDENGNTTEY
jgi:hypothetical protein